MKRARVRWPIWTGLLLVLLPLERPFAVSDQEAKMAEVMGVLESFRGMAAAGRVPVHLLGGATAVAIVPAVVKVGLVVGGHYGKGVLCSWDNGHWSAPLFVTLSGGGAGWRMGAQATDLLLVIRSSDLVKHIVAGAFALGTEAPMAVGPTGVEADEGPRAAVEVYAYSRGQGLFAGMGLGGARLRPQAADDRAFYKADVTAEDILAGRLPRLPLSGRRLQRLLLALTGESE